MQAWHLSLCVCMCVCACVSVCLCHEQMAMVCFTVFLTNIRWMSILLLVSTLILAQLYLRWLPYLSETVNCVRVATFSTTLWAAIILAVMAFNPGVDTDDTEGIYQQR